MAIAKNAAALGVLGAPQIVAFACVRPLGGVSIPGFPRHAVDYTPTGAALPLTHESLRRIALQARVGRHESVIACPVHARRVDGEAKGGLLIAREDDG